MYLLRMLSTSSKSLVRVGFALCSVGGIAGCGEADTEEAEFAITSTAFTNGTALPAEYTCAGKNFPYSGTPPVDHVSPQLDWTAGPGSTQSYAIVFTDVTLTTVTADRPTIDERGYHWAIYNIPASTLTLPKGLPSGATLRKSPALLSTAGCSSITVTSVRAPRGASRPAHLCLA